IFPKPAMGKKSPGNSFETGSGSNVFSNENIVLQRDQKVDLLSSISPMELYNRRLVLNVNGRVVDSNGEPLIGVNILVKGTNKGTTTDFDGQFILEDIDDQAVLMLSYIGYHSQEISVDGRRDISIVMLEDIQTLDEVVVVGYGTQKKVNLTGAVESIKGDRIANQQVAQTSQALTGLVPGLTAIQSSGQPGKDNAALRIRGIGSIGASNNPLILIDGVEGDVNSVDANDIADISVLKDAASAAIYGSRASNGVIIITTKRAQKGGLSVNYKNYLGVQSINNQPEYLGALEFLRYSGSTQEEIDAYAENNRTNPDVYPNTDWVEEVFTENGFQQYHSLRVNGGTDRVGVLASFSFLDQGANIKTFDFERYNGRFNTDIKVSDKIDLNFDLNFSRSKTTQPSFNLQEVIRQTYRIPPIYHAIHSDGSWGDAWNGQNPIAVVTDGGYDDDHTNYFRGVFKANYRPIPELNFSLMYSPENNDGYRKIFIRSYETITDWESKSTRKVPNRNSLSQSNARSFTNNFNAIGSYDKTLGNHNFSLLAGYEFIKSQYETFGASRTDFILQDYQVLNAGSEENDGNSGSATHSSLVSYFSRAKYSFKERYLFEANIRRDASSRFDNDHRVGIFPSVSVGWRLSEEAFIKDMDLFSNLKLRASWGQLGNQQIGSDFPYVSSIGLGSNYIFNDAVVTGASQNVLANKGIMWETTETTNVGVDVGLFESQFVFTFDYFVRQTNDILLALPIPLVIGLNPSTQNAGNVENKGWDFSATWVDDIGDFSYSIGGNISDVKNKVTNLAGIGPIISGTRIIEVGSPIDMIYGYESAGVFQSEEAIAAAPSQFGSLQIGNLQYKDQLTIDTNGDGIPDQADGLINPDDRVKLGNPFPTLTYGMDLNAGYKGFDLLVALQGVGKRDVLLTGDVSWALFNAGKIQKWQAEEFWTPENPDSRYPKISPTSAGSNDIQTSSTWIFDASYLRVRNVTLSYTFPRALMNKLTLGGLRLYLSGQNVMTFDKLPTGVDPLTPTGTSGGHYPVPQNFLMGVDLTF
ncbi:MAG TPA: TonB-dependent receptor, partial [Membranihabitans sp.]|nr:TonB-dependent receptor [Membranihabitans sp.]